MSSSSSTSPTNPQRASRFIEGEPLNHSPSATTSPLFANILSEQDQHESLRRTNSRSRQGSNSSTSSTRSTRSTRSRPETSNEASPQKQPIRSTRPLLDWTAATSASSVPGDKGLGGLGEGRQKETTTEKIVGRLRALTSGQSALERKIQKGEVVPYPGT